MRVFQKISKGFTLAEVLITLGVIGVVAAVSMPTLVMNHKKNEYVVRLRKSHSLISQALVDIMREKNAANLAEARFFADPMGAIANSVKATYVGNMDGVPTYKWLNGATTSVFLLSKKAAGSYSLLNDGSIIYWPKEGTSDSDKNYYIAIDVNGFDKPNQVGRDVFSFVITSEGNLEPGRDNWGNLTASSSDEYTDGDVDGCDPSISTSSGRSCAAKIMNEGWKMNY